MPAVPPPAGDAAVQQVGGTFTGLAFLAAAFVVWRSGRVRAGLAAVAPARRPGRVAREVLLYALLFALNAGYGILYAGLAGAPGARHARTFLALAGLLYLGLVPRWRAWREAAGGA
jgi:hypothetical protein